MMLISKIVYHKETVIKLQEVIVYLYKKIHEQLEEINELKERLDEKDKIIARQARELVSDHVNQDNDPDGYRV